MRLRTQLLAIGAAAILGTVAACSTGSTGGPDGTPSSLAPGSPSSSQASPSTTAAARSTPALQTHSSQIPVLPSKAPVATPAGSARSTSTRATPGDPLPLKYSTGSATQVITVTASSSSSTDARLQTWTRSGGRWVKVGASIHAYLGRSGTSENKHEGDGNTPAGSFTLTQAFGYESDPGTALPYFKTDSEDWWISQPGSLYNTHQRCASTCSGGLSPASPSEHLYYTQPNYAYAVVIDYNTRNAGAVRQGAGSAVFLHVQTGKPTSGCVSVDRSQVIRILKWLTPSAHPRILIGVG